MSIEVMKKEVSSFFLNNLEHLNTVEFISYEYENSNNYLAAYGVFEDSNDPVSVIYSIPEKSNHLFFTITEGNGKSMASDFAAIQQYSENVAEICIEHSVPTDNGYLNENGYVGYVFIPASNFHSLLEEPLNIKGNSYQAIAVIPVSKEELELKRSKGISGLYDYWKSINKDCVQF